MFIALNLIALAVGYKIFADATKEKGGMKDLGRAIGIFIMIVAFTASAFSVLKWSKYCAGKASRGGFLSKMCPIASSSKEPSAN